MQFQWSKKKYTLKDLIAQSKDKLPVIVNVAEGYSGSDGDDAHDIAAGSIFFIYAMEVQSRIVALTDDEKYLSMSRSCPVNFHVILNDRSREHRLPVLLRFSKPCRLNDIVLREHNNLGDLRIQMAAPEAGGLGPMDAGCSDIQGTLRVLDLYDEHYLLCHAFVEGTFNVTEVVSVPSYLPLTVVLATGIKHGSRTDFKGFLNQVNASALKFQQDYAKQPRNAEEIIVFSDPPNGDYEYIDSTNRVSRIPSLKIVDTTRNPETEVIQPKYLTATSETRQGEFLTVPRLPPRNLPRSNPPVERPKLEEKVPESRVTWTTSSRRPLPPVPDQTGRGSSVTDECWGDERTIVERKPEAVKSDLSKKSILPLKTESRFLKGEYRKSPSHSPIFPLKFGNIRSAFEDVLSDSETLQRGRLTVNACQTKAPCGGSATSDQKPEVQKNSQSVTWSSWSFTSLTRGSREEKKSTATSQKLRPPVAKKPSVQPTATKTSVLTSRSSTGALKELDEAFLDVSKNCVQRPGTLTLGQLDSSGYDGDLESYYDEIKSPMTINRLSQVDQSRGTDEETPQQDYDSGFVSSKRSVADNSETLSLRSTDTGRQESGGKSESENELDSSYEEISLPSSRTSSAAETASDSGVSSARTNVSTPKLNSSGVHNFINVKHDLHSSRSKDIPDTWLPFKESLNQVRTAPLPSTTKPSWRYADDVPIDIASLSVEQVSACLTVLNLSQYVRTFREQQIDGALLSCLDKDVLVSDFGFRKFDAIKLAKFARDGWRPKMDQEDTPC